MVNFANMYLIQASQIEYIDLQSSGSQNRPYGLRVVLLSGRSLTVNYNTAYVRNAEWNRLNSQIEAERKQDAAVVLDKLNLIQEFNRRIENRQMRIWRQLNKLLGIPADQKKEEP